MLNPLNLAAREDRSHLVVVEDDPTLRMLWEMAVETWRLPLRLTLAEDGYEAILKISADKPNLIITDIEMPNISGRELVEMLGRNDTYSDIPIIVVSSSKCADLLSSPSVVACYTKPAPFLEICDQVAQVLGIAQSVAVVQ